MRKKLEDDKKPRNLKFTKIISTPSPPPPAGEKGGSPRWRECIKEIIVVNCLDVAGGRWGEGGAAEHPEEEAGRGDEEDPGHHRPDAPQADLCGKNCLVLSHKAVFLDPDSLNPDPAKNLIWIQAVL